jgi:hypothetical protein
LDYYAKESSSSMKNNSCHFTANEKQLLKELLEISFLTDEMKESI